METNAQNQGSTPQNGGPLKAAEAFDSLNRSGSVCGVGVARTVGHRDPIGLVSGSEPEVAF